LKKLIDFGVLQIIVLCFVFGQPGLSPPACININKTTMFCEHSNPFGNSVKSNVRTEFSIELDATNLPLNLSDFTIRGLFNT
jgi:hypothetical protein